MASHRKPQTLVQRAARLDRERHRLAKRDGRDTPYTWEQLIALLPLPRSEIEGYRRIMALPASARALFQGRTDLALSTVIVALRHLPKAEKAIVARVRAIVATAEQHARDTQDPEWRRRRTERARQQRHAKETVSHATPGTTLTDPSIRLTLRVSAEDATPSFTICIVDDTGATAQVDDVILLQRLVRAAAAEITRRNIKQRR